jgi:hypothetical protein
MAKARKTRKAGDRPPEFHSSAHSVHPLVIRAALVVTVWFVIAMAISFSGTIEADYLLAVVVGFSVAFFTLVLGLASHAAARAVAEKDADTLGAFLKEEVAIDRGSISGWEATVQILMLPVTLAIGGTIIGFIFVVGA